MRRLAPVLLVLTGCASHHAQPPVSGPPTDAPEVLPMVESRVPYQPAPTTTVAPTTTHTHPTTTAVVPLTTSPPVRAVGECGGWRAVVAAHFPGEQIGNACRVLLCESEGNPNAVSPTNDHGLFQINAVHRNSFDWANRYDPHTNTSFAASLWRQQGWGPWTCQP